MLYEVITFIWDDFVPVLCGINTRFGAKRLIISIRITSYNVCYTKLLRSFRMADWKTTQLDMANGRSSSVRVIFWSALRGTQTSSLDWEPLAAWMPGGAGEYGSSCLSLDNGKAGGRSDCVITSYSIHYTKLYELKSLPIFRRARKDGKAHEDIEKSNDPRP